MRHTLTTACFALMILTGAANAMPAIAPFKDLHDYAWLFEEKNKINAALNLKHEVVRAAFERGIFLPNDVTKGQTWHLNNPGLLRMDLYSFSCEMPPTDFIELLRLPIYNTSLSMLLRRIERLETDLGEFLIGWSGSGLPSWLEGHNNLHGVFSRNSYAFALLAQEYLIPALNELPLRFAEPNKDRALATLCWASGLRSWLIPLGARYGEERTRPRLELKDMQAAFTESLRQQGVPMAVQMKFFEILGNLIDDPQRLKDPHFVKAIENKFGKDILGAFNDQFHGYMRDESRRAAIVARNWLAKPSPAHDLHRILQSGDGCADLLK